MKNKYIFSLIFLLSVSCTTVPNSVSETAKPTAKITEKQDTAIINEEKKVKNITISTEKNQLSPGEKIKLIAEVILDDNTTVKEVDWLSSDQAIATISSEGILEGIVNGEVVIKAISKADNSKFAELTLTVNTAPVEVIPLEVKINNSSVPSTVRTGDSFLLEGEIIYSDQSKAQDLLWKVSDSQLASISSEGRFSAQNPGKVIVTAQSSQNSELSSTIMLEIQEKNVSAPVQIVQDIVRSDNSWQTPDLSPLKNDLVVYQNSAIEANAYFVFNGNGANLLKVVLPFTKVENVNLSGTNNNVIFSGDDVVYTTNIDGSTLVHVRNGPLTAPVYSPDAGLVVYTEANGVLTEIYISAYHGSHYQKVTSSGTATGGSFAPDNNQIVYINDGKNLMTINKDGSGDKLIYAGTALKTPHWSPDGTKIAFIEKKAGEAENIYIINIDGSALKKLTSNTNINGTVLDKVLKWSADSKYIFFSGNAEGNGVYIVSTDASLNTKLSLNFSGAQLCCTNPVGKMIYVSDKSGTDKTYLKTLDNDTEIVAVDAPARSAHIFYNRNYDIYAVNDGLYYGNDQSNVLTKLPGTDVNSDYPEWAQDLQTLYSDGGSIVNLVRLDGTGVQIPLGNPQNGHFDLSPDQTLVLYTSVKQNETNRHIYKMNSDTSNKTQLTNTGTNTSPSWSPDGKLIVYESNQGAGSEIYIMNSDGSGQTALTNFGAYEPKWSPDGKNIAFTTEKDGKKAIYMMNTDGSNPVLIMGDAQHNYHLKNWR